MFPEFRMQKDLVLNCKSQTALFLMILSKKLRHLIPNAGDVDLQLLLLQIILSCIPLDPKEREFFLINIHGDGFENVNLANIQEEVRLIFLLIFRDVFICLIKTTLHSPHPLGFPSHSCLKGF